MSAGCDHRKVVDGCASCEALVARNRRWEEERRAERQANLCSEDMAYRGTECVCGQHQSEGIGDG